MGGVRLREGPQTVDDRSRAAELSTGQRCARVEPSGGGRRARVSSDQAEQLGEVRLTATGLFASWVRSRAQVSCPHGQNAETCPTCLEPSRAATDEDLGATLLREGPDPTPTPATLPPDAPQRIGRFIVLEVRGSGGMGVVYLAYDPALDRRVAIKVLKASLGGSQDSGGTTRLVREAQAMAQLSDPHVVPVYDVGSVDQSVFIAMEFIAGLTLQQWLAEAPRSWRQVLAVLLDAGRGLEAAHRAGLIHRDFKPGNVLIGPDGHARVTDFGLARSNRQDEPPADHPPASLTPAPVVSIETPITRAGAVMGTPGYMAPEQYVGAATSAASDQFSFGVALYEALYGERPFPGHDLPTLARLTQQGLTGPAPKDSKVPAWLWPIVVRALAPLPAARYPSMRELLSALQADPSLARRRWAFSGLVATLLVAALALTVSLPRLRARDCEARTEKLAEAWGPERRAAAQAAFLASGQPWAQTVWDNTRAQMDTFLASWKAQRLDACDAHFLRRDQNEAQLALRLSCLDRRLTEVTEAAIAVQRLTPASTCANLRALEARARLPEAQLQVVSDVEQRLAEGRMFVALGRIDTARERLEPAVALARRLGNAETLGLALLELGRLERMTDHFAAARLALDEAARAALGGADDVTAVQALATQTSVVGWRLERPAEALALANVARGLLARVPKDVRLEALLDEAEGDARWVAADNTASLAAYQRALDGLLTLHIADDADVSRVRGAIAWLSGQGREAIGLAAEALRRCEEALRPVHLECAFTELTLARAHLAAADAERTLTLATDSAHRFEQLSATRTRKYSEALVVKVDALKALARPADALAATEQLVTALSAIEGNTDLKVSAGLRLAEAHWKGAADRPRAITVAERALELATEAQRPELAAEATTWLSTHHLP